MLETFILLNWWATLSGHKGIFSPMQLTLAGFFKFKKFLWVEFRSRHPLSPAFCHCGVSSCVSSADTWGASWTPGSKWPQGFFWSGSLKSSSGHLSLYWLKPHPCVKQGSNGLSSNAPQTTYYVSRRVGGGGDGKSWRRWEGGFEAHQTGWRIMWTAAYCNSDN